jgi:hypothetical protein
MGECSGPAGDSQTALDQARFEFGVDQDAWTKTDLEYGFDDRVPVERLTCAVAVTRRNIGR